MEIDIHTTYDKTMHISIPDTYTCTGSLLTHAYCLMMTFHITVLCIGPLSYTQQLVQDIHMHKINSQNLMPTHYVM